METVLAFTKSNYFLIMLFGFNIILFALVIWNNIKLRKLRKAYSNFMNKLGNGDSIEDMLKGYLESVKNVEDKENEIKRYLLNLDNKYNSCIQKIGLYKYNAFKNTGNKLSFTLAILDKENNGVMLNGVYSFEGSNIYAKAIQNGNSIYVLTPEEKIALDKAINGKP